MTITETTTINIRYAEAKIAQIRALHEKQQEALERALDIHRSDLTYGVSTERLSYVRELNAEVKALSLVVDYIEEFSTEMDSLPGTVLWKVCKTLLGSFSRGLVDADDLLVQNFRVHLVQRILTDFSI